MERFVIMHLTPDGNYYMPIRVCDTSGDAFEWIEDQTRYDRSQLTVHVVPFYESK